jgi:hypothetical protein
MTGRCAPGPAGLACVRLTSKAIRTEACSGEVAKGVSAQNNRASPYRQRLVEIYTEVPDEAAREALRRLGG